MEVNKNLPESIQIIKLLKTFFKLSLSWEIFEFWKLLKTEVVKKIETMKKGKKINRKNRQLELLLKYH